METCADNKDNRGFYNALLGFIMAGIGATKNPVLAQVAMTIMPNLQRLQYIVVMLRNENIKDSLVYFETIIEALEEKNVEKGVQAIEAYIKNEKEFALQIVKSTPLSVYLTA